MSDVTAYKIFAHDLSSPVRGGPPVWDGTLPYQLPEVAVDTSGHSCGAGWNACRRLKDALRIGGLWPRDGRPSRVYEVRTSAKVYDRGDKCRAATWTVTRELSVAETIAGIRELSEAFGPHADVMAESQIEWLRALSTPAYDRGAVECGLAAALAVRGLDWALREQESPRDTWAARDAWDTWSAKSAKSAWDARDARCTWDAKSAWDARDALTTQYASLRGWVEYDPMHLTAGIREAYAHGLGVAVPIGPRELGWAMVAR